MVVGFGYAQTTNFTTSGSFIPPAGVTSITVNAYGAGGGGGHGANSGTANGGGGGGGGGFALNAAITVTPGTSYPITIGTGGTAGTVTNGGTGGATTATFGGTSITANGGTGGLSYTNSATGGTGGNASGGTTNRTGGAGKTGTTTGSGGGGGGGGTTGNGGSGAIPTAGTSGGGNAGAGGAGSTSTNTIGANGNVAGYGGGGGGGTGSKSGGAGAGGYMAITYTCPNYNVLTAAPTATGPFCGASSSVVTLRSATLTTGTYTVTYKLTGTTTAVGNTATMSFTAGAPGTGTFTTSSLNTGATTITITNLSSGTSCSSAITANSNSTIIVTNVASPTAVAGSNINTCATSGTINIDANLDASTTNSTSILWTSNGTGTFVNANSLTTCTYTPSTSDIAAGSVILTLTANGNSPCTFVTSTKTLTISPAITAYAGAAMSFCSIYVSTNICADATATNQTNVAWTSSGTGTFTNANSLTTCTYTPSPADITAGNVTLTLTATNAGCSITSTKTLTIIASAAAVAGTDINMCNASGAVNITTGSSATNYSAVTWTSSGTGTFVNPNSLTICTYSPSATDILDGGVTLTLTATGLTPCSNDTSTKALNIFAPTAIAGDAISTCSTSSAVNITSGSSATNYTTATWTSSGTGTFVNPNSLTTCTYTPSAADITAGNVTLTLTASRAGCSNDTSTKILTIYSTPTITATVPATRTGTGTVILGATPSAGTPYWYTASTGGTSIGFGSSFTTPTIVTTTTFYVEAVNGSCSSSTRTAVIATVTVAAMTVTGNATAITNGSVTPSTTNWTDFGSTNSTRTFTINNTSSATGILNIGAISISGANASDFTVTTLPSNSVGISSSTTFIVTFSPLAAGTRTATISIVNNDSSNNPYVFAIKGTGVVQGISITGNATAITNGASTTSTTNWTDFGTGTLSETFTITNTGNVVLTIGAISFTGTNASDFSIQTAPSTTIGSYGSTTFIVLFTPSASGARTATINIVNNDSTKNPYTYAIKATSTALPLISVQGNATTISNGATSVTTSNWTNFSNLTITRTFTINNTGNFPLTIGGITFTGVNPGDFSILTPPSATIAALGNTTFTVLFTPSALGLRDATVKIVNNDSTKNPFTFAIEGNCVAQAITLQGNATNIVNGATTTSTGNWTDFSTVTITRTFTINNTGNTPLTIGAITFTGTNPGDFSILTPPSATVPAFGSTTFTVLFTGGATSGTIRSAIINIVNNDSTKNPFTFKVQGTCGSTTPTMNIVSQYNVSIADGSTTPSAVNQTDFGSVSIDSGSVLVNFIVKNTGSGTITIGGATFTGANASDFTLVTAPSTTIASGGSSPFQIAFNPTTKGIKTATFSLVTSVPGMNPYNFDIKGLGVQTYLDTDTDGVTDNLDMDDDNDEIPDLKEQTDGLAYPLANLVSYTFLNETFGAGTTRGLININTPGATCNYCYEDGIVGTDTGACNYQHDYSLNDGEYTVNYLISDPSGGATNIASWSSTNWTAQSDHTGDPYGRMGIFNASYTAGTFYETTITGVIPNIPINYSFWVLNIMSKAAFPSTIYPNITVEFVDLNNTLISTFSTGDIGRCTSVKTDNTCALSQWLNFTTSVNLGNVTSFIVRFKNNATGGNGNDLALDDIKITQNYVDSDGDGIANIFDLDDENDGIPDIEEAGFKAYSNGGSKLDSSLWVDTNHNGILDAIDAQITAGTYSIADTDGDGVPNYLDLDSDNDSSFDVDEANILNGDGDINDDGKGDLLDSDNDGILDLYDNLTGFGTTLRTYAKDTDGDGIPDYLELDPNNDGIYDIQTGLYGSLDTNNDGKIDGSVDIDKDGILDSFDTNTAVIGSPRDLGRKLELDFDGRNDYAENTAVLGGLAKASLMAWIDLNSAFSTDGVIVGQDKFQIRVTSAKYLEVAVNSTTLTYSTLALNTSQWYHVAAVYGGGILKLYLNGILVASQSVSGSIAADATKLTLGRDPLSSTKYFKGKIDEIRVFNTALTDAQVQKMVYQEIQNTSSQVRGAIVPKNVPALPFANLLRYYRMDTYKDDIVDDLTTSSIDKGTGMKIYNFKNIYVQQAPMPFVTKRTGTFATAIDDSTNDIRGLDAMDQDWSIIQVKHNVTEVSNNIDLGMLVDPGVTVTMNNDTKIQNDWYLKLDGTLILGGKSQLVETTNSDLDVTSAGSVHRDQQGQSNLYNYNYWSSPVGPINSSTNNNAFTVDGVMKDGTTATPQNITWTTGLNGSPTSPVTLSSYWIFKYQNLSNAYANWAAVGQTGSLLPAQGYTLKGSGAATATQNYTFVGKPNNGVITTTIAAGNLNLSGNPYPSAIDANAFILGNSDSITGTLYFWEHASNNNTHTVANYQGGYSALNLTGGTGPVAPADISGLGTSSKTPNRYIPVGQGFFIVGSTIGGTVTFDNSHRGFIKEDDSANSSTLFKHSLTPNVAEGNNAEDPITIDTFKRVRIGLTSSDNYHRQILLGFMENHATDGIDAGYDAVNIDNQLNDMYFMNSSKKLNIQGVGYFDTNNVYPIGIKTNVAGTVNITLDSTENLAAGQNVYVLDNTNGEYHEITSNPYSVQLPQGLTENRFTVTFKNGTALANTNFDLNNEINIAYSNSVNTLNIKNNIADVTVEKVTLYNLLGQLITTFELKDQNQQNILLPIKDLSTGTYIVKVKTDKGDTTKKIVFN